MIPEPRQAWLRKGVTLHQILAMDFKLEVFSEPKNLRTYLMEILYKVWEDGENFDGKRPFGNSDWQDQVAGAFIREGLLDGDFDDYGRPEFDDREFLLMIKSLIYAL